MSYYVIRVDNTVTQSNYMTSNDGRVIYANAAVQNYIYDSGSNQPMVFMGQAEALKVLGSFGLRDASNVELKPWTREIIPSAYFSKSFQRSWVYNNGFTPASLNPLIWLDGADAGNITLSSGHVASWANKGSSGGPFANGAAAQQPTYSTTDPDFTYSVTSDGSDFLPTTSFPALSRCSIVFPFKQVTIGTNYNIIAHIGSLNSNGSIYIGFFASNNRLTVRWLNGGNVTQKYTTTQFGDGSAKALIQIDLDLSTTGTGQIPNIYVNNVAETLNNGTLTATAGTSTANNTAIFAESTGTYASICKMPEFIVTSDILSTTDRNTLYNYLKNKWGTP